MVSDWGIVGRGKKVLLHDDSSTQPTIQTKNPTQDKGLKIPSLALRRHMYSKYPDDPRIQERDSKKKKFRDGCISRGVVQGSHVK